MNLKSYIVVGILFFVFIGCGYKPSSHYVNKELSGKVYVDLKVNIKDPKNSVLLKDAMIELLTHRLDSKLTNDKSLADSIVSIELLSVTLSELQYDASGYIKLYKANANIKVVYQKGEEKNNFTILGTHDFSIEDGGTISETKRYEAIKIASEKALDEVISKIAILSFKQNK